MRIADEGIASSEQAAWLATAYNLVDFSVDRVYYDTAQSIVQGISYIFSLSHFLPSRRFSKLHQQISWQPLLSHSKM